MKFLVISRPRPGIPLPDTQQRADVNQQVAEFIRSQMAAGRLLAVYNLVPRGGVAIVEVNSADELLAGLAGFPWANYMDYEIHPLQDVMPG